MAAAVCSVDKRGAVKKDLQDRPLLPVVVVCTDDRIGALCPTCILALIDFQAAKWERWEKKWRGVSRIAWKKECCSSGAHTHDGRGHNWHWANIFIVLWMRRRRRWMRGTQWHFVRCSSGTASENNCGKTATLSKQSGPRSQCFAGSRIRSV